MTAMVAERANDRGDRKTMVACSSGNGAETAGDELLAAGALADAPRQHVQLFDRVFHERSLLWVAGRP